MSTGIGKNNRSAVVIGAGLGGLATALRLAQNGWQVTVCEKGDRAGGKMNRWTCAGFTFDTGPSLITMPWVFRDTFAAVGERLEDHIDLVSMRPIMEAVFADGTRFIYSNALPEWTETIRNLEPRDVEGFYRLMRLGARIFELSKETFLRNAPTTPPDLRALKALRHFPLRHAWGNYDRAVCAHVRSPYLRQLFNRYPTYVGSSPYASPATLLVIPYIEYAFGGWYVKGGLYTIVEALLRLCGKSGVEVRNNATVSRISTSGRTVDGVILESGERINARVVVMNGDAAHRDRLLHNAGICNHEADRSMSGVVLLLGLHTRPAQMHHHTVFFSADYPREFMEIFRQREFPTEPTVYVSAPSLADRSLVKGSGEAIFVMANAPATGNQNWSSRGAVARERMMSVLQRGGLLLERGDIAVEQMWTPETFAQRYNMPGGAIYGTHSHGWRRAFFRPPNKDRFVKGLYYVGGSTHPGGGTPTVLLSAKITSEMVSRYETA